MKKHFGKQVIERPRRGSRTARSAKAASYGRITQDSDGYDYEGLTQKNTLYDPSEEAKAQIKDIMAPFAKTITKGKFFLTVTNISE